MAKFTRWVPIGFCDDQQVGAVSADGLTYFPETGVVVQRLGDTEQASSQYEGGMMSHSVDDSLTRGDISAELELEIVEDFWRKACERAKANRPNTAKIESYSGAHYHAAVVIIAEMRRASEVGR